MSLCRRIRLWNVFAFISFIDYKLYWHKQYHDEKQATMNDTAIQQLSGCFSAEQRQKSKAPSFSTTVLDAMLSRSIQTNALLGSPWYVETRASSAANFLALVLQYLFASASLVCLSPVVLRSALLYGSCFGARRQDPRFQRMRFDAVIDNEITQNQWKQKQHDEKQKQHNDEWHCSQQKW